MRHDGADYGSLAIAAIQVGWLLLLLSAPLVCVVAGRAVGVGGGRALVVVSVAIVIALAAVSRRGDEPLHANGHAWREAREVLIPSAERDRGSQFIHGPGGIALQWLLADAENGLTGTANPFRISRLASAAAAGGVALLVIVLVQSAWAGLAAGCVWALMPLARMLAVSGSPLAILAWLLPWSLALLLAAAMSGSGELLVAAALAAALGILSHTAMLAWPAALVLAWLLVARHDIRWSWLALGALVLVGVAWGVEAANSFEMLTRRNEGRGLLTEALRGFRVRNLFTDPSWVSPALRLLVVAWVITGLHRQRRALMAASVLPAVIIAIPLFAVMACSSDAVRYQGALLSLATGLAVAGLWQVPVPARLGRTGTAILRATGLALLVVFPLPAMQQPVDPAVLEHRLVEDAVRRMEPGTLVIIPYGRFLDGRILTDFPDFLLPQGSRRVVEGDPAIETHRGPRLLYLGLACISWEPEEPEAPHGNHLSGMRPECRALRGQARPWMVRSLAAEDLPRGQGDRPWTFHELALDEPFGFFAP